MIDRVWRSRGRSAPRALGKPRTSRSNLNGSLSAKPLRFEPLEPRTLLSVSSLDGAPYIYLGPSDNIALDQPRVTIELLTDDAGTETVGPASFSTFLLDTGANSVLAFASAVADMSDLPPVYATEGTFVEEGVAGTDEYDISAPYRFDFAGASGLRNTLTDARILSDPNNDISMFGPWGIVGMPAMASRVTTLDMTVWAGEDFSYMDVDFSDTVPPDNGHRFSVPVDNRLTWNPEEQVTEGSGAPIWADIPFLDGIVVQDGTAVDGTFLFDTGAQLSVMPVDLAMGIGLDANGDGLLDENDDNFARYETVGGIGGQISAPVFLFDEFHVPTEQGPDLVWTDLQWLVLDIAGGQFGVFGSDLLTSGWIEPFFGLNTDPGYFEQVHFDFTDFPLHPDSGPRNGLIHFDLNPNVSQVTDASVPGAMIIESDRYTMAAENGMDDVYQIVLTQQPAADVRITLSNPAGELTAVDHLHPANDFLDFTPANWNVPQKVRVTAVNDGAQEGFHRSSVFHTTSSSDPDYQDVDIRRVLTNIVDLGTAGVMLLPNDHSTDVAEGGNTNTYQVVLTSAPKGNLTVELLNSYGQVTAVDALNPGNDFLVFTPENWATPQTVLVTAVDDAIHEGPHQTRIMHRLDTSDYDYQTTYVFPMPVNITDNDTDVHYADLIGRVGATGDWYVAQSDGTAFTSSQWGRWSPNVDWQNVRIGDFNGDGKGDVVGLAPSGEWYVAESNGTAFTMGQQKQRHWGKWSPNVNWVDVRVGDFDGDGKDDLVGRVSTTGDWYVAKSNGTTFTSSYWGKWSPNVNWNNVQVGDFNGDGKDDLVGRAPSGDWYVATSTGTAFTNAHWGKWSPNVSWDSIHVGDFSGDGKDDLVARVSTTGDWYVATSSGAAFSTTRWGKWSPNVAWDNIRLGDFNGDGKDDLVARVSTTGDWYVATSNGAAFSTTHWGKWSPNVNWANILVGDFSGDGRDDLVGRVGTTGDWYVAKSSGTSFANEHWGKWSPNVDWLDVQVGDFDGAGNSAKLASTSASLSDWAAADKFWADLGRNEDDEAILEPETVDLLLMD